MHTIFSIFAALAAVNNVVALPTGSPVCTVGVAAPSSLHLTRSFIQTGGLPLGGFKVFIGEDQLGGASFINRIAANTNLSLQVSGAEFKGVLVILNKDGTDLTSRLTTNSSLLQTQSSCSSFGYGGFTHTSRDLKKSVNATINMPANLDAFLDVNVVVVNNDTAGSIYYYSRYMLSTVPATSTPTKAPVKVVTNPPTNAPNNATGTTTPTNVPMEVSTKAPRRAPVNCDVLWWLYNSQADRFEENITNGTVIEKPPPCGLTNIRAVVPCGDSDKLVTMESFDVSTDTLIHIRPDQKRPYFLFCADSKKSAL